MYNTRGHIEMRANITFIYIYEFAKRWLQYRAYYNENYKYLSHLKIPVRSGGVHDCFKEHSYISTILSSLCVIAKRV